MIYKAVFRKSAKWFISLDYMFLQLTIKKSKYRFTATLVFIDSFNLLGFA